MEKEAFEPTGLIPRSIIRTVDRFVQQLLPGKEKIALQEYRVSRYQILVSIKSLLTLFLIPLLLNSTIKALLFTPLIEHFWNSHQSEIFLNEYQEKRAFSEMHDFSEKMFFESLLIEPKVETNTSQYRKLEWEVAYSHVPPPIPMRASFNSIEKKEQSSSKGSYFHASPDYLTFLSKKRSPARVSLQPPFTETDRNQSKKEIQRDTFFAPTESKASFYTGSKGLKHFPITSCTSPFFPCPVGAKRGSKGISSFPLQDTSAFVEADVMKSFVQTRGGLDSETTFSYNSMPLPFSKGHTHEHEANRSYKWLCSPTICKKEICTTYKPCHQEITPSLSFLVTKPSHPCVFGKGNGDDTSQRRQELIENRVAQLLPRSNASLCIKKMNGSTDKDINSSILQASERVTPQLLQGQPLSDEEKYQALFQIKSLELAKSYNQQSITAITNLLGDFLTFFIVALLFRIMRPELIILKSFLTESVYSLSDTTKSFLLILGMDLLVGFHSPRGWELALEGFLRHIGLPENENFILLFVALFPVFLDTVFKYWIFRYLNKISPSTVVTYHSMIE